MRTYTNTKGFFLGLLTLCFLWMAGAAQAQNSDLAVQLEWKSPVEYSQNEGTSTETRATVLFFDKAIYPSEETTLPYFSERLIPTNQASRSNPVVTLVNQRYETVPENERSFLKDFNAKTIPVKAWLQTERKRKYVRYEFLPFRKNNQGQLERLVSFTPEISWEANNDELQTKNHVFSENSILASGKWHKIAVSESGIHKLTHDQLVSIGFENPEQVRVFGNGGKQLPFDSSLERPDDLIENATYIYKGNDGVFNTGDYILFYAKGVVHWKYDTQQNMFVHRLHQFTHQAYYYLTEDAGTGLRISSAPSIGTSADQTVTSYDYYNFREKDSINMLGTGRLWAWKHFNTKLDYSFNFDIPNKVEGENLELLSFLLARSTRSAANSSMTIKVNDQALTSISFPGVNTSNYEALYAATAFEKVEYSGEASSFLVNFQFYQSNPAATAWLDYLDVNTRCHLRYNNAPLHFRDKNSQKSSSIAEFQIQGAAANLQLWEVTALENVQSIPYTMQGNQLNFKNTVDEIKEYVLFNPSDGNFHEPIYDGANLGEVANQNLHGLSIPEMVIITADELREQAEELAELHRSKDGLDCLVISPELIFNEFSSGIYDPTAIRDFMRMFYERGRDADPRLKYLLLFGDGSYDNKKAREEEENKNYLPTYQSLESLYPTSSYVTDDFFGLLDQGETLINGLLDIGVGRFPIKSPYQASIMVDKVKHYTSAETLGDWRNLICFIGDDEDGNAHMRDANTLAGIIDTYHPTFNVDKIFLDAYQQVVTATGETYPEVNRAINDRIKKGALIMNYLGHGSEKGLAHENILSVSDIKSWDNYDKLPLFMTATCEFSRFDDHDRVSAGEWVLLNSGGGGIGLFTTTRLVYSSPNFRLNREFYDYAFDRPNGKKYRFGDLMRLTKNAVGSELNKLNFTLLADPALTLNFPELQVTMTHVNGVPMGEFQDTLKALSKVEIQGFVSDERGNELDDFNGVLFPTVYDKEVTLTNLANDGGALMEFDLQENIIFRGKSSVDQGKFKFDFIVPKDIGYNIGFGKFSFYCSNGERDGTGVNLSTKIGGSADSLFTDNQGPGIRLFINDTTFAYGGTTNEDPVLVAKLKDENGINTTGNGIGHDITAILDGNTQNVLVLNDYYESDLNNYKAGTVRYPINDLEPGEHELSLKVWDILNNSGESEIKFEVFSSEQMILKNLLNYPNPFTTSTAFYFEHNQSGFALDAQIQIYTLSGRLVKSFDFLSATETALDKGKFRVGPVYWDGLDQFGDKIGRGTYFYRVKIRTQNGRTQEAFQKLVKL